jgi:two-component system, cell cycle response regulator
VASEPFAVDGDKLHLTVSIGVAARHADDRESSDLLPFADRALYAAKANGRNCVVADNGHQLGG